MFGLGGLIEWGKGRQEIHSTQHLEIHDPPTELRRATLCNLTLCLCVSCVCAGE